MIVQMDIKPRQLEIIEAAGKLLSTSGISGLTIRNLAFEMNFSESAIYRHFSSKEEIIITLLRYLSKSIDKILKESFKSDDFEKDFTALFRKLSIFFKKNPFYVVTVFSERRINENDRIGEKIIQLMNNLTKYIQAVIKEGQKRDVITNSHTPEQIAQIIIPAYQHQMFKWKINNFESDIVRSSDSLSNSLLELLKKYPN